MKRTDNERNRILDSLDNKAGALMQFTSVLMIFISLPLASDRLTWSYSFAMGFFLLSLVLNLYILFYEEIPSDHFVTSRIQLINLSVFATAIGVLLASIDFIF